jgi:hypothetical protein
MIDLILNVGWYDYYNIKTEKIKTFVIYISVKQYRQDAEVIFTSVQIRIKVIQLLSKVVTIIHCFFVCCICLNLIKTNLI